MEKSGFVEGPLGPTDWYYRNYVPKDPDENLKWRRFLIEQCSEDAELAEEVWIICSRDILFYINSFGWLLEPRDKSSWSPGRVWGNLRKIPFITRDYQDANFLEIQAALGSTDIIIKKSREMGASWMLLYQVDHDWRFTEQTHIGLLSKDADTVCAVDVPGSLFAKLKFIDEHLPLFLRPTAVWSDMHNVSQKAIVNPLTESTIAGEAAVPHAFRGDRKKYVVQDEQHFFPDNSDTAVHDSMRGVTPCRVIISTVNRSRGQSGVFHTMCMEENAACVRIAIDWKQDKEKAAGLYTTNGDGNLEFLDPGYRYPQGYQFILDGKTRSPYYDWEWRRPGTTPQMIAAELDMDFGGASAKFFDADVIKEAFLACRTPWLVAKFVEDSSSQAGWLDEIIECPNAENMNGICLFWLHLEANDFGSLRPPKAGRYSLGIDISAGVGGTYSSYSSIEVADVDTGEQVFEWRCNTMRPDLLALFSYQVGKFFNWAMIAPEITGTVGQQFMDQFAELNYPNPYIRQTASASIERNYTKMIGVNNMDGGVVILGDLQAAMRMKRFIPRSRRLVEECERYQYDDKGKLKHPLVGKGRENAPERSHGDCAIAAACCNFAMRDREAATPETIQASAPWGSLAWDREQRKGIRTGGASWWDPLQDQEGDRYVGADSGPSELRY